MTLAILISVFAVIFMLAVNIIATLILFVRLDQQYLVQPVKEKGEDVRV